MAIFVNFDIVFVEKGYAVVIAELADRDEGAGREAVEDVSGLCCLGECFCEWEDCSFSCFNCFSVGDLDAGSCAGWLDVDAVFFCGGV